MDYLQTEKLFMTKSQTKKYNILLLDGDHKNALAILRHLGKTKQYFIDVVSSNKASICFFSKYVSQKYIVSNPKQNPDTFSDDILKIIEKKNYLVVIPVSYISFQLCSKNKEKILQFTHLTIASAEHITIASSKIETYKLAEKIGVPYPRFYEFEDINAIENIETNYPCVLKAPVELGKNIVDYAHSKEELILKYKKMCAVHKFNEYLPIVQKFIVGEGAGFFAFYKDGTCQNYFMHKRIREYPPSGGASVVAEAFYNEQILKDGTKLLDALKWEGVAMVEFKKDNETGIYNLMEINAKFWGSLDLALSCGANFPKMLIADALHEDMKPWNYQQKRFQWVLNGDLYHLLERPLILFSFLKNLCIAKNDIWLRDLGPNIFQVLYIPIHYYKKLLK